ncbi:hypothetical protein Peur_013684 [Populus x canadensis]
MARFRFTVNEKRSTGASQQQEQEQQQKEGHQRQQQAHSESDNNTCLRRPMLPPVLALPAFEDSNRKLLPYSHKRAFRSIINLHLFTNPLNLMPCSEDNGEELQEHIHRDIEEIRRDLDSVKEELWRKRYE